MRHRVLLGALLTLLGALFYSSLTALVKAFSGGELPLPMLVFMQSVVSLLIFLPFLFRGGLVSAKKIVTTKKLSIHLLRAISSLSISYFLFSAVKFIPLVSAMLLANISPLILPFIAYFFLGKKIKHHLWIPIIIGFIGITLVLHPDGKIFQLGALLAVGAAIGVAVSSLSVRQLSATDSTETIMFYFFLLSTVISGIISVKYWVPLSSTLWLVLVGAGIIYFASQYLISAALALASAQLVSTLLYANIIFSALFSMMIWHHFPSILTWIGIVITVLGGILCIRAEHQYHKRIIAQAGAV